ncbi:CBS domain-containing protein [Rubricella aquisinus]|uniref:CBS domain-containing protein n=1 Tax=Rubricella aquisinus TaxID=2028108 RepID=A0A840WL01_9RHOB|nr:CBS domain-containing protein [Rubricella aquisinus]MBB5514833.1 CBS domain-containing protein [Rubricella aquisinus]
MLVQHVLGQKPATLETITPDASLRSAAERLGAKKIGALIVSKDGKSVDGILSERDIVRKLGEEGAACLDTSVANTMTAKVIGCAPTDSMVSVLNQMTDGRFRHMPVMDGGTLVGIISIGDAVKARMQMIEAENSALTDMISGY